MSINEDATLSGSVWSVLLFLGLASDAITLSVVEIRGARTRFCDSFTFKIDCAAVSRLTFLIGLGFRAGAYAPTLLKKLVLKASLEKLSPQLVVLRAGDGLR